MILIDIPEHPVPWAAHQGFGRKAFNPRFKEKEYYQWKIKGQYEGKLLKCPIRLECFYSLEIPKSFSKIKRYQAIEGKVRHQKKPDIDNLNKFLCDCLKGIVFVDDNQIFEIFSHKQYCELPKTIVRIFPEC